MVSKKDLEKSVCPTTNTKELYLPIADQQSAESTAQQRGNRGHRPSFPSSVPDLDRDRAERIRSSRTKYGGYFGTVWSVELKSIGTWVSLCMTPGLVSSPSRDVEAVLLGWFIVRVIFRALYRIRAARDAFRRERRKPC